MINKKIALFSTITITTALLVGCGGTEDKKKFNSKPTITLKGASTISINIGDQYLEPGATAFDKEDGNISLIDINSTAINTNKSGTYNVTYNVTDSDGNKAQYIVRTVIVKKAEIANNEVQLRLPNKTKVLKGDTLDIYLDNIVNVKNVQSYRFYFTLNGVAQTNFKGEKGKNRYVSINTPPGKSNLKLTVTAPNGEVLATASAEIQTLSRILSTKPSKVLIIGDSFTDNPNYYLNNLANSLKKAGQTNISFVGTKDISGVRNEGRGGWTAGAYMNKNRTWYPDSPFLKDDKLDFKFYFHKNLKSEPEIVVIQLGVNDVLGIQKDFDKYNVAINDGLNNAITHLSSLVDGIQGALPNTKVLLMMPTPPRRNSSHPEVNAEDYRDTLQEYWKRYMAEFGNKESQNIYIVPTYLTVDPLGFNDTFVHPNEIGGKQIAKARAVPQNSDS